MNSEQIHTRKGNFPAPNPRDAITSKLYGRRDGGRYLRPLADESYARCRIVRCSIRFWKSLPWKMYFTNTPGV